MSDQRYSTTLTLPMKGVFALEVREQADTLVARILGFNDEDDVPARHVPPLPEIVEANSTPYRRLPSDAPR